MSDQSQQIVIKESFTELGNVQREFTEDQIKFIMSAIAPTLNKNQVWLFLLKANKLGLNPLLGEIFAYSNDKGQLVIIEGRNGKRNLAAKSGKLAAPIQTEAIYVKEVTAADGQKVNIKTEPWDGKLWGARSTVRVKDLAEPIVETVRLDEYNTGFNVWKGKPETMIKKVAESQALSAALPGMMLDLYGEGENFVSIDDSKTIPQVANANESANEMQLETLKRLGADMEKSYTGQEAVQEISRLSSEKRQGKSEK